MFLHGFGADLNGWRPVHRLLPETQPALAIDLPGHGLSPLGEEASFEALVEAARAVLIEEGISAAHLVGHSLGGAVAAALAHEPGVKALSLMLIAPAGLGEETNAPFFDGFLMADTEAALTLWLNMLATRSRRRWARRSRRPPCACAGSGHSSPNSGASPQPSSPAAGRRSTFAAFSWPLRRRPRSSSASRTGSSPAHHAEGLSGLIALHRFPHIGHMPHLEARREVAALIEELVRAAQAS